MRFGRACVLVLPAITLGCFGQSSGGGGGGASFDSGTGDASFLDSTMPEMDSAMEASPMPEAAVDAPVDSPADVAKEAAPEAGFTGLEVVVTTDSGPESGVTIVVQDATGAVVTSGKTDATGRVTFPTVAANSQMTAVLGPSTTASLVTVVGVQPGDVIPVFDTTGQPLANTISVDSVPANPPAGTASLVGYVGQCQITTVPGSLYVTYSAFSTPCWGADGQFPVLVVASGGADAGFAALGYTYQKNNVISPDGGTAHVNMTGSWTPGAPTTVQLDSNGWPDSGAYISGQLGMSQVASGVPLQSITSFGVGGPATPPQVQVYPGYADFLQTEGAYNQSTPTYSQLATTVIATRNGADAGPATIDMSQALPLLDTSALDASAAAAQPVVVFGLDGGSVAGVDGTLVQITWTGFDDGGLGVTGMWTFVVPPGTTHLQAPALPAAVSAWAPVAGASFGNTPSVAMVEASFITGYAQLRAQAAALPLSAKLTSGTSSQEPIIPPLPVDGTLKLTAYTQNGD
jgi:hypothetical protein